MLAIFIFMGAAFALAAFLVVTSMRTSREDQRQLALAREREESARLDAERARALRAMWETRIAEDRLLAEATDVRRVAEDLGGDPNGFVVTSRTVPGRFRPDVPAPFTASR